jgi:hypothetical protein
MIASFALPPPGLTAPSPGGFRLNVPAAAAE